MATFRALIKKGNLRSDKTWNVVIRFTHESKVRFIPTTMYITKKELTSSFKIKNQQVLDKCEDLIKEYRKKIAPLNLELNKIDIDSIVDYIKTDKKSNTEIDFVAFARKWCASHTEMKGIKNYLTAINSFCSFYGREKILCSEVTLQKMKEYEVFLSGKKRALSLYTTIIARLFNEAREYYNDEDNNIILIKQSLSKYKPKQMNVAEKRALPIDIIREIYKLPYFNIKVSGHQCRRDLAKDCFVLSFCLMGINSADLYNAVEYDGEYLTYYRTKTKDRRSDKAKMVIRIHPFVRPLLEKYKGKQSVFNFRERFSSMGDLNKSINKGLKEIGKELGVENLQFYSARHSFATIAANEVRIPIYVINDMLCHVDTKLRITELYIQKDFTAINEANFKLIEYVFGNDWSVV